MIPAQRWEAAQAAERGYWYPADPEAHAARRAEERARQAWYAGLLLLDALVLPRTVLELGAGPQGLVTRYLGWTRAVAVEPMPLGAEDRTRYARHGVTLIPEPAETYRGALADEVWMTNVLQHVQDPGAVLETARRHAAGRVRVFEWVDEPVTVVHPHVVTLAALRAAFPAPAWRLVQETTGRARTDAWDQAFAALVVERGDRAAHLGGR